MFVKCLFALFVLVPLISRPIAAAVNREQQHESKLSECAAKLGECDESEGPVCGTDDRTYPTRCHLLRVQCSGYEVSLRNRGGCKACVEARQYARKNRARNTMNFLPRCRKDGNYAAVQCFGDNGCWCSDSLGNPIQNTSVRTRKPKCRAYRRGNRRRSPPRLLNPGLGADGGDSNNSGVGGHRPCSKADRVVFNNNLLDIFRSEYTRAGQLQPHSDAAVLDWKFAQLDGNGNKMLDKQEVRELKKLVKRAVKPRRCGRAFGKYCNGNKDEGLSRSEWSNCLAKDGGNRNVAVDVLKSRPTPSSIITTTLRTHITNLHTIHTNHNPNQNQNHDHTNTNIIGNHHSQSSLLDDFGSDSNEHRTPGEYDEGYESEDDEDEDGGTIDRPNSRTSLNYAPSFYFLSSKTEPTNTEPETESNCWSDQAGALEEQLHSGNSEIYMPECTSDGRYQREQCYRSTPYCWCVHEDTGKPIPHTLVNGKRPQCDEISAVRPMKGCLEPRHSAFLKELKEYLKTQILSGVNTSTNTTIWKTEDERIATLSFVFLDKNKNKSWERKEWKVFRDLVTGVRNLRKCGKKMPRYCDVNGDKKISMSEWVDCLTQSTAQPESSTTAKSAQSNETATSRLLGSNPLEQYLKD
ncbi:SPARC-related modular calcium-binding protein 2 isoform X2 [Scaptodrosophila lebanonensis]|uniref:SPARC-related modular calcium-binding protein 2 isoform X2 n=1 Tax=Drosophila lebanonensis TaxID=7225 RepID=A0A6J2TW91_DROLE|nr:SPARC-related modular calcium-binding protein 2 isoform X2 [Scaptodrosophila lebanonensis]